MQEFKKERKMKVYEATTVSRGRWWNDTKYKSVPQIRLQGLWLENDCGFEPGTEIKVICEDGRLVIERCESTS